MTLVEFKNKINSLPKDSEFSYSISEPFSWRGSYAEVAFSIEETPSNATQVLEKINMAYDREFTGYKGGEYTYDDYTDVHFESGHESYSDGDYVERIIQGLTESGVVESPEKKLVDLLFK